ncbi:hypothetical protein L1987_14665 [Smallanthus sonchifolius]|uniref:Uncharacterized protein n=1 Tax=Smallanthus sonchifolius TaxID=185202 RepID=A0ACB9J499_9ASTR|nr:hypothetical protein L1987_14665 [Smallanthus sonchifolius]
MCRMHTRPTDVSFIGNACAHLGLVSIGKGITGDVVIRRAGPNGSGLVGFGLVYRFGLAFWVEKDRIVLGWIYRKRVVGLL